MRTLNIEVMATHHIEVTHYSCVKYSSFNSIVVESSSSWLDLKIEMEKRVSLRPKIRRLKKNKSQSALVLVLVQHQLHRLQ
jgi:hypothetical protein